VKTELFLRQYRPVPWDQQTPDQQQADVLEMEAQAGEAGRTLLKKEPSHVIKLSRGYTYMWDLRP
jgi:hypothetical protein